MANRKLALRGGADLRVGRMAGVAMIWHRPTDWSAETQDGLWYAEEDRGEWVLYLQRGRGRGCKGRFASLEAAQAAAKP